MNASSAQPVEGSFDLGQCPSLDIPGPYELPDGVVGAEAGFAGNGARRQPGGRQARADLIGSFSQTVHAEQHTAQKIEQSSAQVYARASHLRVVHHARMKMSIPAIMQAVKDHTGLSWRAIATEIRVSPNIPQIWAKGGQANANNLEKLRRWLRLTPNQLAGLDEIPDDFVAHLPTAKQVKAKRAKAIAEGELFTRAQVHELVENLMDQLGVPKDSGKNRNKDDDPLSS